MSLILVATIAALIRCLPMLLIFVLSGVGGALAYALFLDPSYPLVGGFPPVYGLIGAFTWLLWRKLSLVGANQARAFQLIAVLMGIQLLFGLIFGGTGDWVADLGGFATGFGLSFFLAPGGWARLHCGPASSRRASPRGTEHSSGKPHTCAPTPHSASTIGRRQVCGHRGCRHNQDHLAPDHQR